MVGARVVVAVYEIGEEKTPLLIRNSDLRMVAAAFCDVTRAPATGLSFLPTTVPARVPIPPSSFAAVPSAMLAAQIKTRAKRFIERF